jgi:hypothetical protein
MCALMKNIELLPLLEVEEEVIRLQEKSESNKGTEQDTNIDIFSLICRTSVW